MKIFLNTNEHSQGLVINVPSLQDLKSRIKSLQNKLIKKSRSYTETLRNSVRKNVVSGETQVSALRKCAKCGEEKPLDKEHYQVVKYFKTGYSYYCNSCDKPVKKEE
jgi:hypothetical protein